MGENKV